MFVIENWVTEQYIVNTSLEGKTINKDTISRRNKKYKQGCIAINYINMIANHNYSLLQICFTKYELFLLFL